MKAEFLVVAAALALLAGPALANTPSGNMLGNPPADQTLRQTQNGLSGMGGDTYGDAYTSPFTDRSQNGTAMRPGRDGTNFLPPGKDANGVPNPRI